MDDEIQEVAKALESAVTFVLQYAKEQGYGPMFPEDHFSVAYWKSQESDPNSSSLVTEDRTCEFFPTFYIRFHDLLEGSEPLQSLNVLSQAFVAKHGVEMGKYPKRAYGTAMLFRYFKKARSFTEDYQIIQMVVDEFKSDITSTREQIRLVYYVENLIAPEPFSLCNDMISFRPVTDTDLDNYAQLKEDMISPHRHFLDERGWICEGTLEGRKNSYDDFNNAGNLVDDVLNALYLVKAGNARFLLLAKEITNTFLGVGRMFGGDTLNVGRGGAIELTQSDITEIDEIMSRLVEVSKKKQLKLLRLPLRRIRAAASRRNPADAFLDIVMALETFLANDTPTLEVTHRFRMRGAAILNDEFGSPRDRLDLLNEIYSTRSRIVHGEYESDPGELASLLDKANLVLKAIVRWYLGRLEDLEPNDVVRMLDEWMVQRASQTAYPGSSQ